MSPDCQSASRIGGGVSGVRWIVVLTGLFLTVFAILALSGPGRIDIIDGQTRYEVARSLVDHGDHAVRDSPVWFGVFPGRDGERYTTYRFPQSVAGAAAILCADATGERSEARRHFFFTLVGAGACAALAVCYAVYFRRAGQSAPSAAACSAAGIFCLPTWFYGTSTFDDVLGAAAIVGAVVVGRLTCEFGRIAGALGAGLLLGLAINCKQPLGAFAPLVIAAATIGRRVSPGLRLQGLQFRGFQWSRAGAVLVGMLVGIAAYKAYDVHKFPGGTAPDANEVARQYGPVFAESVWPGLVSLAVSPGCGAIWYCPCVLLMVAGLRWWRELEGASYWTLVFGAGAFAAFVASLAFFAGDPAWGPRYLTPVFALGWLAAPAGAARLGRMRTTIALAAGLFVQLLGLSVDPNRLYIERRLPSAFYIAAPWSYFDPALSHLLNRPREIVELYRARNQLASEFTPAPSATFAPPVIDYLPNGPDGVRRYQVWNSFRPWWISLSFLPTDKRPVDLRRTLALLGGIGLCGLALCIGGCTNLARAQPLNHPESL